MREELARREGLRGRFTATFIRTGEHTRGGYPVIRLLFQEIKDERGTQVTDHLWFSQTSRWLALNLQPGETVRFEARVNAYWKGYRDKIMDFKLNNPTRIVVTSRPAQAPAEGRLLFPDEIT